MPDHLHLVLSGIDERADFQHFMANWKQRSAYHFKQRTRERLWQDSYFDHVLRDDEETKTAVKYVLENPVRKGFVKRFEEYAHSGSDMYSIEQLREFWR
jgi:REP element-mobilizing transposase RayT